MIIKGKIPAVCMAAMITMMGLQVSVALAAETTMVGAGQSQDTIEPADTAAQSDTANGDTSAEESASTEAPAPTYDAMHLIVAQDGTGDFTTVTEAVNAAADGATVRILPGTYENEVIKAWGKTIYLAGTDRDNCIIKNATGSYSAPPLEMGAGSLRNLTIIASEAPSTDENGFGNYAVHVEDDNLYDRELNISNCTLISYNNSALGAGLRGGCRLYLSQTQISGMGANGSGLFFHDSDNPALTGRQEINLLDCTVTSEGTGMYALAFDSQNMEGAKVVCRFVNTIVSTLAGEDYLYRARNADGAAYDGWCGLQNYQLTADSFGSNQGILIAEESDEQPVTDSQSTADGSSDQIQAPFAAQ